VASDGSGPMGNGGLGLGLGGSRVLFGRAVRCGGQKRREVANWEVTAAGNWAVGLAFPILTESGKQAHVVSGTAFGPNEARHWEDSLRPS